MITLFKARTSSFCIVRNWR